MKRFAIKIKCLCHYKKKKKTKPFGISTKHLHQNSPEPHKVSAPEPSGTSQSIFLCQNLPEPHEVSAPEPSGTSQGICPGTLLHQVAAQETSGTSPSTCTGNFWNRTEPSGASAGIFNGTLRNLTRYLQRNPPEPHEVSAPEPLRNLTRYLHQNPPELCPEPGVEAAPVLIWAKDPIAKFCCWGEKTNGGQHIPGMFSACWTDSICYQVMERTQNTEKNCQNCKQWTWIAFQRTSSLFPNSIYIYIYTYVVDAFCCMLIQIAWF